MGALAENLGGQNLKTPLDRHRGGGGTGPSSKGARGERGRKRSLARVARARRKQAAGVKARCNQRASGEGHGNYKSRCIGFHWSQNAYK